ncbi:MAG TPA: carboxypeptidase-like regulatory domain-containing protein, partial [Pyrinomonadaceae bacterium]|nr:carboxypeptidase-like regulatory domain-containing protein [Pyrinomonadaceae bacterium]
MKTLSYFSIVALVLILAPSTLAQTDRASLRGTVKDPNGAAVVGSSIKLVNLENGQARTTVSNEEGGFAITSLQPGDYRLEAEAPSFGKAVVRLKLLVNQQVQIDVSLEVRADFAVDRDLGMAEVLKTESAVQGAVIENRQITELPLDGRNFYELSLLVPGAVPPAPGSAGSVRGDFAFSVNGAREDSNNFLLDGVYNVDPKLNTFAVRPPVDAIREFEMLTSSYDAAFGRNPGAQVNVVLKSGGNDVHGSLFEFHRNAALDARNFFAPAGESKPKYIRNQFGGSIGGPIKRDRTF